MNFNIMEHDMSGIHSFLNTIHEYAPKGVARNFGAALFLSLGLAGCAATGSKESADSREPADLPVGAETATTIGAMTATFAAVGGSAGAAAIVSVLPVMAPGMILTEIMAAKSKAKLDAMVKATMAELATRDQTNEQARQDYYVRLFKDFATVNHALATDPAFMSIRGKFCFPFDSSCPDVNDPAFQARFDGSLPTSAQRAALEKMAGLLDAIFDRAKADEGLSYPFSQEKTGLMFRLQQWREVLKSLYEGKFSWATYATVVHSNAKNASEAEKIAWSYIHLPPATEEKASLP
jgi:hypothetical protein